MDILFSFTGFHDPFHKSLIDSEEQPGPIIYLLKIRKFDRVCLFDTATTRSISVDTQKAINALYPDIVVHVVDTGIIDPTNYKNIISHIKQSVQSLLEKFEFARFYISVASGTPHIHACWLLLAASGEIPAKILHVRPPRFVTKDAPAVTEVDLSSTEFPSVRFTSAHMVLDTEEVDINDIRTRLGIIGDHQLLQKALTTASMLGPSRIPVLITGKTGTGKELFARLIHEISGRPIDTFITVNCAAIPESLVESYLFGHMKGSFTDATKDQEGKFTVANKGTLFLDEIGELPLSAQAKLLRVIQDGVVEPIGKTKGNPVDVRIVAATNRNLKNEIKTGKFREDLYYRLNVGSISLPSLNERRSDIPKIALSILDRLNLSLRAPKRLTTEAMNSLYSYNWQGNVRDLENVIERSVVLCRKDILDSSDILFDEPSMSAEAVINFPVLCDSFSMELFLGEIRNQLILKSLDISNNNQSKAARLLGISPQAIHKYVKQNNNLGLKEYNQD